MAAKRHFIEYGLKYNAIDEYLARTLWRAGYGGLDIQKTPIGYRIRIHTARPGMVIGRRGRMIRRLTEMLADDFGLENPQLEVEEIQNPDLNARVMAYRLIGSIERGYHFRRAAYAILRRVMEAGARGCEIVIKGKLSSQRGRAESFRSGFVAKSGTPADVFVDEAVAKVTLKPGELGVHVRIMQPGKTLPDEIKVIKPDIATGEMPEKLEEAPVEAPEDAKEKEEVKLEEAPVEAPEGSIIAEPKKVAKEVLEENDKKGELESGEEKIIKKGSGGKKEESKDVEDSSSETPEEN
ncbi:MAG: 30S ribosomal protein S3 [Candidatus Heimdallarchaeota archaeon]